MKNKLIFLTALLFIANGTCAKEISNNSLQRLKNASLRLNKALKRYTSCITGGKVCSEQDKKKVKRAAQAMVALLITYGLVGAAVIGTGLVKKYRERGEVIAPQKITLTPEAIQKEKEKEKEKEEEEEEGISGAPGAGEEVFETPEAGVYKEEEEEPVSPIPWGYGGFVN